MLSGFTTRYSHKNIHSKTYTLIMLQGEPMPDYPCTYPEFCQAEHKHEILRRDHIRFFYVTIHTERKPAHTVYH